MSKKIDLKVEEKFFRYSQLWAANLNRKVRHCRYKMLIPFSYFSFSCFLMPIPKEYKFQDFLICSILWGTQLTKVLSTQKNPFQNSPSLCKVWTHFWWLLFAVHKNLSHLLKVWIEAYFFLMHLPTANCLYSVGMSGP